MGRSIRKAKRRAYAQQARRLPYYRAIKRFLKLAKKVQLNSTYGRLGAGFNAPQGNSINPGDAFEFKRDNWPDH